MIWTGRPRSGALAREAGSLEKEKDDPDAVDDVEPAFSLAGSGAGGPKRKGAEKAEG